MKRRLAIFVCAVLLAACGGNAPAPEPVPPPPLPAPVPVPVSPSQEAPIGTVRVNASTLNIRSEPSASSEIVAHSRKGERLTLLADSGEWLRVRLNDGTKGWVSAQHVVREGAVARPRRGGCPPDSDYSFVKAPTPSFADSGAHGMVVVEAAVDARGDVTSTRVISNGTGDEALAVLAEREIRGAHFSPPVRSCAFKAFIFTYKRAF